MILANKKEQVSSPKYWLRVYQSTRGRVDLPFIPGPDFCHLGFQKARLLRDMITHASQHLVVIKSSHLLEEWLRVPAVEALGLGSNPASNALKVPRGEGDFNLNVPWFAHL